MMGRSNFLRVVACALMFIDHIGAFFYPSVVDLRIFGRMAFPLFAYLVAEGFHYSRDVSLYARRLFLLACSWQPFHLCLVYFGYFSSSYPLNVLYCLLYGLILIVIFERYSPCFLFFSLIFLFLFDFALVPFEYGSYGALLVLSAYVFRVRYYMFLVSWGVLSALVVYLGVFPWIQLFAPLAVFFLILPFSISCSFGRSFYFFYPLHLLFMFSVSLLYF